MPPKAVVVDPVLGPLTLDRLTQDVWVYQRRKGHRFSVDDQATAYVGYNAFPTAARVLDLGCGLGSVLLHLAWKMQHARLVGVEAQEISFELLRRNLERSGLGERVTIHHGDFRFDTVREKLGGPFDLITGTPPYFPPDTALDAMDEQRAFARVEYRGGVEAYMQTGAPLLRDEASRLVICGDADAEHRVTDEASNLGLALLAKCVIVPRAGKRPLFSIWTLARTDAQTNEVATSSLTMRDVDGNRTEHAQLLREFSGLGRGATDR